MSYFGGKEDFKRSLHTKNLKQAKRLLRIWSGRTEEVFTTIRSGVLTQDQMFQLAQSYMHDTLRDAEENRANGIGIPQGPGELRYRLKENEEARGMLQTALTYNHIGIVAAEVAAYLSERHGIQADTESPEFRQLTREILKTKIDVLQIEGERMQGNYRHHQVLPLESPHVRGSQAFPPAVPPRRVLPLSKVVDEYIKVEYTRTGKASNHSVREYEYHCRLFQEGLNNKDIQDVTRENIREYLELLKKYPSNARKLKPYRDKTVAEIAAMNVPAEHRMSDTTIDKYLARVHALLKWATNEGYIEKNPGAGIQHVKKKQTACKQEHYLPFDREDINGMVQGLLAVAEKGELEGKPERLWLPLIGLFTGARANELAQLHIEDVQQDQKSGVWFFKIESDEEKSKRVKNASSNREVPIHPTLLELGFLEYYQKVKKSGAPRLWMNLTHTNKGYYRNFSNWFLKSPLGDGFKNLYMTTHRKKVFHSFRGTLINELKHRLVPESVIQDIVGHTHKTVTFDTYALPHRLETMLGAMLKIDYGVDLNALKALTRPE
ncbi:Phage integrase family protein [Geobacter sp. DSM 9736]|nr:tyrosine-type recombinase/integrase [Geobacter sp. DSM 9736]SNB45691.1 Phage integrase family protein [Geobacter sp. DSM 9736]